MAVASSVAAAILASSAGSSAGLGFGFPFAFFAIIVGTIVGFLFSFPAAVISVVLLRRGAQRRHTADAIALVLGAACLIVAGTVAFDLARNGTARLNGYPNADSGTITRQVAA